MTALLHGVANYFVLGVMLAVVATLAWFVYALCLQRLWRVRRIRNIRLKRILEDKRMGR